MYCKYADTPNKVTTIKPKTIPDNNVSTINFEYLNNYLKPTLACHTNANKKNKIGITGIISVKGLNTAKAPGNLFNKILSIKINSKLKIMFYNIIIEKLFINI